MIRLYEGMFIIDSNKAREDYAKHEGEVHGCITRHGGEVVKSVQWDDRRLAYEMDGVKRGTFILVHFNAEGEAIAKIERQVRLNENIVRALILRDEDGIETTTGNQREAAEKTETQPQEAAN